MSHTAPPIVIPLQGGLGNQLFELCAGLALGACQNRRILFSDDWLRNPAPGETPRTLAVAGLLAADELTAAAVPRSARRAAVWSQQRVGERGVKDDPLARVRPRTRLVHGYFQRLDYVDQGWPLLRERLERSPFAYHRHLVRQVPTKEEYGALHYRLGDYISNATALSHHGSTAPKYFVDAIHAGFEATGLNLWLIVSDDPERARELLAKHRLSSEINLQVRSADAWEDLATLSAARALVISNSSFSWWAGYMGDRLRAASVIAPRPWFASTDDEPPIFPASWTRSPR